MATRIYIDGVRHVGDRQAVASALQDTVTRCATAKADVEVTPPASTHSWLGVDYDFIGKTVTLSESFRSKLSALRDRLDSLTVSEVAQMYGAFYSTRPVFGRFR